MIKLNPQVPLNWTKIICFKVFVEMVFELIDVVRVVTCHENIIYIDYKDHCVGTNMSKVEIGVGIVLSPRLEELLWRREY